MSENETITPAIPEPGTYDWGELLLFRWKTSWEGYSYALSEYTPEFETPELAALMSDDDAVFTAWWRRVEPVVADWKTRVGDDAYNAAYDAHLDVERSSELRAARFAAQTEAEGENR